MGFGVNVTYLDYSKVFDSVQHLSKLQAYGIKGDLLKWISNFLIGRQQKVILQFTMDRRYKWCTPGVVLGPLLFDGVQSTLEMFADDSKLYRIIKYSHNVDTLQQYLYISSWSKLWLLNFNTAKCSIIHLGKNSNATYTLYDLATNSNNILQSTTEQKDLRRRIDHTNHEFYYPLSQSSQQSKSGLGHD